MGYLVCRYIILEVLIYSDVKGFMNIRIKKVWYFEYYNILMYRFWKLEYELKDF